jgi:hypothetical protein
VDGWRQTRVQETAALRVKFARREGAQLVLITLGHGIREGLVEHADIVIDHVPFT